MPASTSAVPRVPPALRVRRYVRTVIAMAATTTAAAMYEPVDGDEAELALLEDDRPVIEQQPKDRIEHACPPWHEIEPAQAWIV